MSEPEEPKQKYSLTELSKSPRYKPLPSATAGWIYGKTAQSSALNLLSNDYDNFNRTLGSIQGGLAAIQRIPIIGWAALAPSLFILYASKRNKTKEYDYIAMACLSYFSWILTDLAKIVLFYEMINKEKAESEKQGVESKFNIDSALSLGFLNNIIMPNAFKMLYRICRDISFSPDNIGGLAIDFLIKFLKQFDFSTTEFELDLDTNQYSETTGEKKALFRYSFDFCRLKEMNNDVDLVFDEKDRFKKTCQNYNDIIMRLVEKRVVDLFEGQINPSFFNATRANNISLLEGKKALDGTRALDILTKIKENTTPKSATAATAAATPESATAATTATTAETTAAAPATEQPSTTAATPAATAATTATTATPSTTSHAILWKYSTSQLFISTQCR